MKWAFGIWTGLAVVALIFGLFQIDGYAYTLDNYARDMFIVGGLWAVGIAVSFGGRALMRSSIGNVQQRQEPKDAATVSPAPVPDLASRLAQLDAARHDGLITDVEYATKRASILENL